MVKRLYVALLDRPALRRVDAIHFTTEAERTKADRLSLDLERRAYVVPPPWRGDATPPDPEAKADRPIALFMSRLHPKKNVARLIEAWAHVMDAQSDARLWIAGDGDEAARTRIAEAGPRAVQDTFSVARVGEQLRTLYASVAE